MRAWTRKNSLGGVKLRTEMDAHEAAVLRSLVTSLVGLLDARESETPQDELAVLTGLRSGPSTPPDDAVLARLLPDFHRPESDLGDEAQSRTADEVADERRADAADVNGALRSLHEPEIIDAKRQAATMLLDTLPERGGKIALIPEQAHGWLNALNDVRIALGTMLGIDADTPDELPEDDPRRADMDVYHWLTWVQDTLLLALMD
ncbi:DUF2017 domain-containing protein [Rhodococcus sp. D2-41]|uniref:DUF2017 domain-containing protein n=1 Tax=Speluncibacter jeojiensis TaxID=2710754 RepID=A0A9X4RC44_9ACTN|nr:DUF2017 domain-containing protein [Rhodococcus sp. D2-41]MDG3008648.1 DUF2017 domain-containing protein [Rhodococcus sp. D2-41]MDG3013144.1 DUF2017 domain-containing protein [Corynebacteriales bacterium D3-21]